VRFLRGLGAERPGRHAGRGRARLRAPGTRGAGAQMAANALGRSAAAAAVARSPPRFQRPWTTMCATPRTALATSKPARRPRLVATCADTEPGNPRGRRHCPRRIGDLTATPALINSSRQAAKRPRGRPRRPANAHRPGPREDPRNVRVCRNAPPQRGRRDLIAWGWGMQTKGFGRCRPKVI